MDTCLIKALERLVVIVNKLLPADFTISEVEASDSEIHAYTGALPQGNVHLSEYFTVQLSDCLGARLTYFSNTCEVGFSCFFVAHELEGVLAIGCKSGRQVERGIVLGNSHTRQTEASLIEELTIENKDDLAEIFGLKLLQRILCEHSFFQKLIRWDESTDAWQLALLIHYHTDLLDVLSKARPELVQETLSIFLKRAERLTLFNRCFVSLHAELAQVERTKVFNG